MRFLIAGASGFLGRAWTEALRSQGHEVVALVRRESAGRDEASWDPYQGRVAQDLIGWSEVVVNLAGAPLVHVPFNEAYRKVFTESRTLTTRTLARAIAASDNKPTFLAQSGIAGYGDHGSQPITEATPTDADTFMGEVTRLWEAETAVASRAGARVVILRTGIVLDAGGGALKSMLPAFKMGVGGPLGSGNQYFSTISLADWMGAATFLATHEKLSGPYNLSGPNPSTNAEFTKALGAKLRRPTFFKVPGAPLRKLAGPIGGEVLASARVLPERLEQAGFEFAHSTVEERIDAALH